jgi:hypothetical protein
MCPYLIRIIGTHRYAVCHTITKVALVSSCHAEEQFTSWGLKGPDGFDPVVYDIYSFSDTVVC